MSTFSFVRGSRLFSIACTAIVFDACAVDSACWGVDEGDKVQISLLTPFDEAHGSRGLGYGPTCGALDGIGVGRVFSAEVVSLDRGSPGGCKVDRIDLVNPGLTFAQHKYPDGCGYAAQFLTKPMQFTARPGCVGNWVLCVTPFGGRDPFDPTPAGQPSNSVAVRVFTPDDNTGCPAIPKEGCADGWGMNMKRL